MDLRYSYAFSLKAQNDSWLFSADCFTLDKTHKTSLKDVAIDGNNVNCFLDIINENNIIEHVENYRKPLRLPFIHPVDADSTFLCIRFSDESEYTATGTNSINNELIKFFYSLAESAGNNK